MTFFFSSFHLHLLPHFCPSTSNLVIYFPYPRCISPFLPLHLSCLSQLSRLFLPLFIFISCLTSVLQHQTPSFISLTKDAFPLYYLHILTASHSSHDFFFFSFPSYFFVPLHEAFPPHNFFRMKCFSIFPRVFFLSSSYSLVPFQEATHQTVLYAPSFTHSWLPKLVPHHIFHT